VVAHSEGKWLTVGDNQTPVLGVTVGDPAGIGPEISVATVIRPEIREQCRAVLYADPCIIERAASIVGERVEVRVVADPADASPDPAVVDVIDIDVVSDSAQIEFGRVQELAGRAAVGSIEAAVADALAGHTAGIVTAPINKEAIWATGSEFLGHTEMLQDLTGAEKTDTMFVLGELCTFFATRHMSLLQAVQSIKQDLLVGSIVRALKALEVFGYTQPRLAVAALNPHGGENGHFGREELDEIIPAIQQINAVTGAGVIGPIPADSVWHLGLKGAFDGILSLYHDQGHIATKTYDFDRTVSVTVGLPILRTSVDHGTAFDIAGTGKAAPQTMISAFEAGVRFSARNQAIATAYPSRDSHTQPAN
jgi:4-hydroxythreonine-4-phosphate dehydrogenase